MLRFYYSLDDRTTSTEIPISSKPVGIANQRDILVFPSSQLFVDKARACVTNRFINQGLTGNFLVITKSADISSIVSSHF